MSPNWFVGFPVEADTWFTKVVAHVPAGIKCFTPADLHMTFAFLGPVEAKTAMKVWQVALEIDISPVSYTFGQMEPFGNPDRPSAYAFTLDRGRDQVVDYMHEHTNALLEIAGKEKESRAPRPHVTIARPPRRASDELRAEGLAWLEQVEPPATLLQIDKVALFTWADDRKRQQFKIVRSRVLQEN